MKLGEVLEAAIWITGDEAHELRSRYEKDVIDAIDEVCAKEGVVHGPVSFIEKLPGTDRVPPVPDHVQGQRVRLLVAEAELIGLVQSSIGSFIANLELSDLKRLRAITRREWARTHNGEILENEQCDKYIEQLGPAAAIDVLRANAMH